MHRVQESESLKKFIFVIPPFALNSGKKVEGMPIF